MQEVAIIAPLAPMCVGDTFRYGQVALHLTVLPNARLVADTSAVVSAVESVAAAFSPIDSVALGMEHFGPHADVVVTEVRVTDELRELHEALREALAALEAEPVVAAYDGAGYRAHVTRTWQGVEIAPGCSVRLDRIAVLDCSDPLRRVLSVTALSGSTSA